MSDLAQKECLPCEEGVKPYSKEEAEDLLKQVDSWALRQAQGDNGEYLQIDRQFKFDDFKEAMKFVNQVANLAEQEGHHPNIHISYSEVWLELYTHAIGGLSENDFIMAAKINELPF